MKSSEELRRKLNSIDRRSYPAYKDLKGQYDFGDYALSIDHVQGDPFAAPSRLSVIVPPVKAGFPPKYSESYARRITLQDHLTRLFGKQLAGGREGQAKPIRQEQRPEQIKGSGKSGLMAVSRCGQEVLERTACRLENGRVTLRFEAGFPAFGRTIAAGELEKMLFSQLPIYVRKSLLYRNIDQDFLRRAIELCDDQQSVREQLPALGLCAFIANGSLLPRLSGVSDRPMKEAVPFLSPASMELTLTLPHRGAVSGMGIPRGVTLFVGGGYHGKSTVLQALQAGVYNHIGEDGRELVIADESAWKLRSEDGRSIIGVDISPFIHELPGGRDTRSFSSADASGSTSQAANLMESLESGSTLLLIDEDTSATNFMIRDKLMQQVVAPGDEPIIPFIQRVRSLYDDYGISSIIVAGSSGSYFHVADHVIQMKEYRPLEITEAAKKAAADFPFFTTAQEKFPASPALRRPLGDPALKKDDRLKLKAMGTDELLIGRESVELRFIEQLHDSEQAMALAYLLKVLHLQLMDGKTSMAQLADKLERLLDTQGLEGLFEQRDVRSSLARPRRQEILAALNRYRKLKF